MQQAKEKPTGQGERLPGDSGVWTFILADLGAFAMFFVVFVLGRIEAPVAYESSRQQLVPLFGLMNTLILLTSSVFMVWAVEAAREGNRSGMLLSWFLKGDAVPAKVSAPALILIAAFKINLVVSHFMELKWQPRPFRFIATGWLASVTIIIIGGYWAA
jgi:Prokaryotic Cytochrome C oxidase subunit IV